MAARSQARFVSHEHHRRKRKGIYFSRNLPGIKRQRWPDLPRLAARGAGYRARKLPNSRLLNDLVTNRGRPVNIVALRVGASQECARLLLFSSFPPSPSRHARGLEDDFSRRFSLSRVRWRGRCATVPGAFRVFPAGERTRRRGKPRSRLIGARARSISAPAFSFPFFFPLSVFLLRFFAVERNESAEGGGARRASRKLN